MGMYTEINIAFELKRDAPGEVCEMLKYMATSGDKDRPPSLPGHAFFECERWDFLFRCDSYYFPGNSHAEFYFDEISKSWFLVARANLKNYDGEIEAFMEWIAPYVECCDGEYFGYSRYEETDWPTLWHWTDGKLSPTATGPRSLNPGDGTEKA